MSLLILGSSLLFVGVVATVFGVIAYTDDRRLLARRLTVSHEPYARAPAVSVALDDGVLKRFEKLVTPGNEEDRQKIRQRLLRAGYHKPSAMRLYYAWKGALALGFALVAAFCVSVFAHGLPTLWLAGCIIVPVLFGYMLPSLWVERLVQRRRESAELGFPDTLDMILICIEAGQGIDQACRRVAQEIHTTSPVLAEELQIVNNELLAGKQRSVVFHDFAERVDVGDIKAFTTVLKQSDEFGVSIAETLRVYAAEMRHKRVMKAEEKANLMPVKVAMGSILFTVPPTMLIMAGPSLIMMLRAFSGGH